MTVSVKYEVKVRSFILKKQLMQEEKMVSTFISRPERGFENGANTANVFIAPKGLCEVRRHDAVSVCKSFLPK